MIELEFDVPEHLDGQRLDIVAVALFSDYSRSKLQQWIKTGHLSADGQCFRPKEPVYEGMRLRLAVEITDQERWEPEDLPIDRVYEDNDLVVVNKPAGLVVHPGAGNPQGTLLNALLFHVPETAKLPRAGIVHRIDKDTSGLLVVAKTLEAQNSLVQQLQARTMQREYEAIIEGLITLGGKVDEPIGRHPTNRLKMSVVRSGKPAVTHYRIAEKFAGNTHIRVTLETGRTHQIRVHMAHKKHPLVGDSLYAGRGRLPKNVSSELREAIRSFPRQALHAAKLALVHPSRDETMAWHSPLPDDFQMLLTMLREEKDVDQ